MSYREIAAEKHASGWNCCQSVLCTCCEKLGLAADQAYHLGAFFGSGARTGELCGAVSGALMALGLAYGDENNRECGKSAQLLEKFRSTFGTLRCGELVGTEKEERRAVCPAFIDWCSDYLEEEFK
mgnify:FL=1